MTRINAQLLILSAACVLAGCNSRDSLYSQGPWGPPGIQRSYPEHSAPWGRRVADERPLVISGASYPPGLLSPAIIVEPTIHRQRHHYESDLPPDPPPPRSGGAFFETDNGLTEQASLPRGRPQDSALISAPSSPPGVFTSPQQASSYAGTWRVTDATGQSCLVRLSSVASLDLYKASSSKCSIATLRSVNMWKLEGTRISLWSRGSEIARLEGSEASLTGALNQTGVSLKMQR